MLNKLQPPTGNPRVAYPNIKRHYQNLRYELSKHLRMLKDLKTNGWRAIIPRQQIRAGVAARPWCLAQGSRPDLHDLDVSAGSGVVQGRAGPRPAPTRSWTPLETV